MSAENDKLLTVILTKCEKGLGIKICGGQYVNNRFNGIFVRKILDGGVADINGDLLEGDQIIEINGHDIENMSNQEAVKTIRMASKEGVAHLIIARGEQIRKEYNRVCSDLSPEHQMSQSFISSQSLISTTSSYTSNESVQHRKDNVHHRSPALHAEIPDKKTIMLGRLSPTLSAVDSGLPSSSTSYPSPGNSDIGRHEIDQLHHAIIPVTFGLDIMIERATVPSFVRVADILPGGDAEKDGSLQIGDILLSVNGNSLVDVSFEEARAVITRLKLNSFKQCDITFIRNPLHPSTVISKEQPLLIQPLNDVQRTNQNVNKSISNNNNNGVLDLNNSHHANEAMANELHLLLCESQDAISSELCNHAEHFIHLPDTLLPSYDEEVVHHSKQMRNTHNAYLTPPQIHFRPAINSTPSNRLSASQLSPLTNGRSIPNYLKEDLDQLSRSLPAVNQDDVIQSRRRQDRRRRLSLDTDTRLQIEQLESAMTYLGYTINEDERIKIRSNIQPDHNGMVSYGDFVRAARDVLNISLSQLGLSPLMLGFATRDVDEFNHLPKEAMTNTRHQSPHGSTTSHNPSQAEIDIVSQTAMLGTSDQHRYHLQRIRRERDDALRELGRLKRAIKDKDADCFTLEDELERTRQDAAIAYRESGELRTRIQLTSEAQRAARHSESDYEEMINRLEKELEKARRNKPTSSEANELQKRLVVLGCQLRKAEIGRRTYQVAVERLTKFAQQVYDRITEDEKGSTSSRSSRVPKSDLAKLARETVKAVKIILEEDALPFGWEEVYTTDGSRYYINHVTQTTSWVHPLSGVQKLSSKDEETKQRRTSKQK